MLWDCWLTLCSLCELASLAYLLVSRPAQGVYWLCVAAGTGYVLGCYCVAVYVAFSPSFAGLGKKLLNVSYLWSLYLLCSLFKVDPYSLRFAFRVDGIVAACSPQKHVLIGFHVVALSLPVLSVALYSLLERRPWYAASDGDLEVVGVVGVAVLSYAVTVAGWRKRRGEERVLFV